MFDLCTQDELDAVRRAGPATLCVHCARPFSEHQRGQTWPGPNNSIAWCDVPTLRVGDDDVLFPEFMKVASPK
jgi:hypothetical protein